MAIETWRQTWRGGFAPFFDTEALEKLYVALRDDDARLIQGGTTAPPPLNCVQDWPVEAADAIGFCGAVKYGGFWKNPDGTTNTSAATVGEVEEFFARACFEADQRLGEPAACRHFLNWFDDAPRTEMRLKLMGEVLLTLARGGDHRRIADVIDMPVGFVIEIASTSPDVAIAAAADWLRDNARDNESEAMATLLRVIL